MRIQDLVAVILLLNVLQQVSSREEDRKWFQFPFRLPKPPPEVEEFFSQIPTHAKTFLDNILPKPLRNIFPNPPNLPDGMDSDESRSDQMARMSFESDQDSRSDQERGQFHGPGRDAIRKLENQLSNMSTGLDTDDNFFRGILSGFKEHVMVIFPGTQWCGDGNRARSDEELGVFFKTDSCCRQHDSCPEYIEREETKHSLYNGGLFTRSHCDCDSDFYDCLKEAADMISEQIGTAYFTALGPQCFRKDRPIVDCKTRMGLTNRCVEYEYDERTSRRVYQWFDNPEF